MKIGDIASYAIGDLDNDAKVEIKTSHLNITARPDESALDVAERVRWRMHAQIAVVDEQDELIGVVDPTEVVKLYIQHMGVAPSLFHEVVELVSQDPSEQSRRFRHEWLGDAKVLPYYCVSGGHRMATKVCPYGHP